MKKLLFIMLSMFSVSAFAYCYDPQSVGGNDTLGNPSNQINLMSDGISINDRKRNNNPELNGCGDDPIELPPIVVSYDNPGPYYYWMGGGTWYLNMNGSGGATSSSNISDAKLDYCEMKDKTMALISALPVSGTASTGYSVAITSVHLAQSTYDYALQDIERYMQVGLHVYPPSMTIINWYQVDINWTQYDIWTNNPTQNPHNEIPEVENGGALQIFAHFLNQLNLGNGNVNQDVLDDMIGEDPQPNISC